MSYLSEAVDAFVEHCGVCGNCSGSTWDDDAGWIGMCGKGLVILHRVIENGQLNENEMIGMVRKELGEI